VLPTVTSTALSAAAVTVERRCERVGYGPGNSDTHINQPNPSQTTASDPGPEQLLGRIGTAGQHGVESVEGGGAVSASYFPGPV